MAEQAVKTKKYTSISDLRDPYTGVVFPESVPVELAEISAWVQSQIDAGIISVA